MKVTRVLRLAFLGAAAGCAVVSSSRDADALVVRAPSLTHPITEAYPSPSRPEDPVKLGIWNRINADRATAGLSAVAWDESAARVADAFCAAQIRESTNGHFLIDGIPPYARTGLAGIFGMQAENAVSWRTTGPRFRESPLGLALAGHADMMRETPPYDGHRRTILDPDATHVGVGWAEGHGNFRMAQEFLTRNLAELTLQRIAGTSSTILVKGKMRAPRRLAFVTIANEPPPRRLTKAAASARITYSYPTARLAYVPEGVKSLRVVGAETEDRLHLGGSGDFFFRFTPSLPGLWTILLYTAENRDKPRPGGLVVLWIEREAANP